MTKIAIPELNARLEKTMSPIRRFTTGACDDIILLIGCLIYDQFLLKARLSQKAEPGVELSLLLLDSVDNCLRTGA
jgi:hypothetical protein